MLYAGIVLLAVVSSIVKLDELQFSTELDCESCQTFFSLLGSIQTSYFAVFWHIVGTSLFISSKTTLFWGIHMQNDHNLMAAGRAKQFKK